MAGPLDYQLVDIDEFGALSIELNLRGPRERFSLGSRENNKYPAKLHAHKVKTELGVSSGLIYLPGQRSEQWEDTDGEAPFRQRRYAFYLSGADFEGATVTYDIGTDNLILWVTVRAPERIIWVGALPGIEECAARFDVDTVRDVKDLGAYLDDQLDPQKNPPTVYVLHESQRPKTSNSNFSSNKTLQLDTDRLQPAMDVARSIKTPYEIMQIRKAVDISSEAHRAVQRSIKTLKNEAEAENLFLTKCRELGARQQAYPPIVGSGPNAAVLHYGANNQDFKDRQLMVLDAGAEFNCYASDVTRTFPLNGSFSAEAKKAYQVVAKMQDTCISMIRPGASWAKISTTAREVAYHGLLDLGIIKKGKLDQLPNMEIVTLFYMHGLGHLVGLDTHDVIGGVSIRSYAAGHAMKPSAISGFGGKACSWEDLTPLSASPLLKDMVITCEPGLYFNRAYIEAALTTSPALEEHINKEVLEKYYSVCGCRIEDCILVTETGYENLTTAPKGDEMIKIINEGA
ncbi:putative Xaa-Pro aminopeptidase [Coniella lustricola]|uniref:Xaa-Pro aminopeptidase n=1 Tax=Coniella lustricola TaxID=2025994 RepID=A0A2T3AN21_9PEZI|nr:putative Xaa-Pro aminopeptidase [Coniella lustricola]